MEDQPKTDVALTDPELLLLDGKCEAGTQAKVDLAKRRALIARRHPGANLAHTHFASRILDEGLKGGRLVRRGFSVRSCSCCGAEAGYAPLKRTCSKGRKGEPNYDKPRMLAAVEYVPRAVIIRGYSPTAACTQCAESLDTILISELVDLDIEVPEALSAPGRPKMHRFDRMRCECGWSGHSGEMRPLRTLLGDGTYPGGCPSCERENRPFGPNPIATIEGFVVVRESATIAAESV